MNDEDGPAVPELTRRITLCSGTHDPAAALAQVLVDMAGSGIKLGDVLSDSGFSYRKASTWANPLRGAGAALVQDLHPSDRGPRGTHEGAVICNGNLYCPKTPAALLHLAPLPPGAEPADVAARDQQTAELARYKLGLHAAEDAAATAATHAPPSRGRSAARCARTP